MRFLSEVNDYIASKGRHVNIQNGKIFRTDILIFKSSIQLKYEFLKYILVSNVWNNDQICCLR